MTMARVRCAQADCDGMIQDGTSGQPTVGEPIVGCEPNARSVRFGLKRSCRALARPTPDEAHRVELVDLANAIRPRTLT